MKERLTERDKDGNVVVNYIKTAGEFKEIVDRLSEYEDLEEQGLIVRLPCKIYNLFYYISCNKIIEGQIVEISTDGKYLGVYDNEGTYFYIKDVFLTRAEAEKKLEELKGELK